MSVKFNGKQYFVKIKRGVSRLDLSNKGITNIMEIEGLETLVDLKELNLSKNAITEIKGLETLISLEKLYLSSNQIEILIGLDTLKNLKFLDLNYNNISVVESFKVSLSAYQFYLMGNPIKNIIRDTYGLYSIQNLKDYSKLSKEEIERLIERLVEQKNKEKHFIGYQFPMNNPSIIKKSVYKIIFSTKGRKIEIKPFKLKESNYNIITEIEKYLISKTSGEDYEDKYKKWKLVENKKKRNRTLIWAIAAIILIPLICIAIYIGIIIITLYQHGF